MILVTKTFGFAIRAPQFVSDMITDMDAERFKTHSLTDPRIMRILSAALEAVDPADSVRNHLPDVIWGCVWTGGWKSFHPDADRPCGGISALGALAISKHASEPNSYPVSGYSGKSPGPKP
jgi:hypothetical protein